MVHGSITSSLSSVLQFMTELRQLPAMLELIVEIMERNPTNLNLQRSGLKALSESRPPFIDATRYVGVVEGAMRSHPLDMQVQIEGCKALRRIIQAFLIPKKDD